MAQTLIEAAINFSGTGDNELVSAVIGQRIRVHKLFLVVSADTNLTFKDGGSALTGAIGMKANGSVTLDIDTRYPWFTTTAGSAFVLSQSGTAQVSGRVYYSTP